MVLWLTGLPGSGKSTVADNIAKLNANIVILRMDDLRKVVTPDPTYSPEEREIVYRSLVFLAKILSGLGHDVIIDATGNLRKWRDLARSIIPSFLEIYLRCPQATCVAREEHRRETRGAPAHIYQKGRAGWPVPGLTVPYEEPLNPELIIDTDKVSADEATAAIQRLIASFV